jgi:hypothetical protein
LNKNSDKKNNAKKNTIKEEKGMKNSYHNDMLNLG